MSPLPALPTPVPEWRAPVGWKRIDLLSDLHLSADTPNTFAGFAAHLRATDADAVIILGDLFEAWVGDDQRGRVFERGCVRLLADTARRRQLAFMPGNRDFLLGDAMASEAGLRRLSDPTVLDAWGRRWLLSHGDALCLDDTEYQRWRVLARTPEWQRDFAARPLDERLALAAAARVESDRRRAGGAFDPAAWADVDAAAARDWLSAAGAAELIHGHTHRPATHALGDGRRRHVLSDWDLDHGAPRAELLSLTPRGLQRRPPASPAAPSGAG